MNKYFLLAPSQGELSLADALHLKIENKRRNNQ
jgi:hypothetical protein